MKSSSSRDISSSVSKISALPVAPRQRLAECVTIPKDPLRIITEYMQQPPEFTLFRSWNRKCRNVVKGWRRLPRRLRIWVQGEAAFLRCYPCDTRGDFHNQWSVFRRTKNLSGFHAPHERDAKGQDFRIGCKVFLFDGEPGGKKGIGRPIEQTRR